MPALHHSVFTGWMPFLPPNQQHQNTEDNMIVKQINNAACVSSNYEELAANWRRKVNGSIPAQQHCYRSLHYIYKTPYAIMPLQQE